MKKLLSFIFVFIMLSTSLLADGKPQAVIIFDASGSMWGQIDGKAKITIAKDALNSVVKEWSPDVELGLTAYGHRKKGDCNDIEALVPVGKVDKNKIISLVKKIQPKGKTPIARSLRKVAEELKFTEEKATIILISDGKESCDANPCDVAKELEKKGIDFVTHVVGFNVDKKTDKELECIAKATGGEYFSAKNATALNAAMKSIVKKVEKVKPKVLKNNIEITAREKEGGKQVNSSHDIYKQDEENKLGKRMTSSFWSRKKEPALQQLPVGKYVLVSRYNKFNKDTPFEVKAGEVTKINVVFGETSTVEIISLEKEGGKWIKASHNIYKLDDDNEVGERMTSSFWSRKKEAGIQKLPVGKYILKSDYNEFKKETPFELKAGEVTKLNIVFGQTSKVEITAVEKEGGRWIKAYHTIYKVVDGEKESGRVTGCNSYKKEACVEQIPVGKYIIASTYNEFKKETPFELKAGEVTKLNIVFGQTSKVEITAVEKEGGRWIKAYHTIYKVVDGEKESGRVTGCNSYKKEACVEQIPVGKYIIASTYNKFKKETEFELKAGEMAKINVIMGQTGKVEITTSEKEGGRWIKSYHTIHKVVDGEKESSRITGCYSYKKEACLEQIPVGKYIITSTYNSLKKETPFEVKAGETTKVHVVFEQFQINTKCSKKNSRVSYEIYANNGRLVHESKLVCSKVLQLTLNKGDYSVEAKVGNDKREEKFTVGGSTNSLTIDLSNVSHEAEIKADTQATTPKETKTQKKEVNLGELGAMLSQVASESNGTHSDDMKEVGALLKGLGGLFGGSQSTPSKKDLAKEKEQKAQNSDADKEFDDLSKELDMFSK